MKKVITFTVTIDVGEGTDVAFTDGPDSAPGELESLAHTPLQFVPQQIVAPQSPVTAQHINPTCPEHHTSKMVPGGTSKRTGKPYLAFWGCPEMGCKWTQDAA